jgi:hypothetical protein
LLKRLRYRNRNKQVLQAKTAASEKNIKLALTSRKNKKYSTEIKKMAAWKNLGDSKNGWKMWRKVE